MNEIEFALMIGVTLYLLVRYTGGNKITAVTRRERMVEPVRKILDDDNASLTLKRLAAALFVCSLHSNAVPSGVISAFFYKRNKSCLDGLKPHERKKYLDLIKEHYLPINFLAAPHWYVMFGIVFVLIALVVGTFTLGKIGAATIKTRIEASIAASTNCEVVS